MTDASAVSGSTSNRPRGSRAEGGRGDRATVWMSAAELEVIGDAASRENLAVGAWLRQAGMRVARASQGEFAELGWPAAMRELMVQRAELMEVRGLLRNVGVNLNAVARVANAVGSLAPQTTRVLGLVERVVARVDEAVGRVDEAVREARGVVKGRRR